MEDVDPLGAFEAARSALGLAVESIEFGADLEREMAGTASRADTLMFAFSQLSEHFIQPHAETNPTLAVHGYHVLAMLLQACRWGIPLEAVKLRKLAVQAKQSARGVKSGDVRRRGRKWLPHAEELARQIRADDAGMSRPRLAEEIGVRWKLADPKAPSYRTIYDYVREKNL